MISPLHNSNLWRQKSVTLPKTNIAPEKWWLEDDRLSFWNRTFSGEFRDFSLSETDTEFQHQKTYTNDSHLDLRHPTNFEGTNHLVLPSRFYRSFLLLLSLNSYDSG